MIFVILYFSFHIFREMMCFTYRLLFCVIQEVEKGDLL